jgi:class I fructose-bisphosphate aldolase
LALDEFLINNRGLLIAYDQGLEHGPSDFDDQNVDPTFIMDIAAKEKFTGVVFQKGTAKKY